LAFDSALAIAKEIEQKNHQESSKADQESETELMVIGGATIYQLMLPLCDRLYITQVKDNVSGDAWFPEFDESKWHDVYNEKHAADEKNQHEYEFIIKEKL